MKKEYQELNNIKKRQTSEDFLQFNLCWFIIYKKECLKSHLWSRVFLVSGKDFQELFEKNER
jgi:hypothetical protein